MVPRFIPILAVFLLDVCQYVSRQAKSAINLKIQLHDGGKPTTIAQNTRSYLDAATVLVDPTTIVKHSSLLESDSPQVADAGVLLRVFFPSQPFPPPPPLPPLLSPPPYSHRGGSTAQRHPSHSRPLRPLSPSPVPQRIRDPTPRVRACPLADRRRQRPPGCALHAPPRGGAQH